MFIKDKNLIVSSHAKERYKRRLLHDTKRDSEIIRFIKKDLSILNIRYISPKDEKGKYQIVTKRNVVFVCKDTKNATYILTTYGASEKQKNKIVDKVKKV